MRPLLCTDTPKIVCHAVLPAASQPSPGSQRIDPPRLCDRRRRSAAACCCTIHAIVLRGWVGRNIELAMGDLNRRASEIEGTFAGTALHISELHKDLLAF